MRYIRWSGYAAGDIVVSLTDKSPCRNIGDMFEIISICDVMYYKKNVNSPSPHEWRLATHKEIELFNSGVTNINDIKIDIQPTYEIY